MQEQQRKPSFTALVTFLDSASGGRRSPVSSGYSAQVEADGIRRVAAMQQYGDDEELVYPGDSVTAQFTLLSDVSPGLFYEGLSFRFYEGEKMVGTGVVTAILKNE